jgi:hypothetical protein
MEVSKLPPADVQSARAGTAALTEQGSQSPASIAPMVDRADIRPLDVSAALQIDPDHPPGSLDESEELLR